MKKTPLQIPQCNTFPLHPSYVTLQYWGFEANLILANICFDKETSEKLPLQYITLNGFA